MEICGGREKKVGSKVIFFSQKWEIFRFGVIIFSKNGEKYQIN